MPRTANGWKQDTTHCPSTDEWTDEGRSLRTVEYYLTLKRSNILTPTTAWLNLEDLMLSEMSPSHKDKFCMVSFI